MAAGRTSAREDFFVRALGEEWVEVEPGIYQHVPPEPSPPEDADPELDGALIDRLGSPEEDVEEDPSVAPPKAGLLRSIVSRRSEDG